MSASGERIARLVALTAPLKGKEFPLRSSVTAIGREPDNNIVIDQSSVSRSHARIERVGERYRARDLGSRNGIKVNDQKVFEAFLEPGDILTVGDTLFKFLISASAPADAPEADAGSAAAPAMSPARGGLSDSASEAGVPATVAQTDQAAYAPGAQSHGVRKSVLVATIIATAVLAAGGVALALYAVLGGTPGVRTLTLPPVNIGVNENRLVPIVRTTTEGGRSVSRLVEYRSDSIRISDPSVVRASRFEDEQGYVVLTGLAGGETDVTMKSLYDNVIQLRVLVRGRFFDPVEVLAARPMSDTERVQEAGKHVQAAGRLAARGASYDALQEYRIAVALLTPTSMRGSLYLNAVNGVSKMEAALDARYKELAASIRQAMSAKDYGKQTVYLQELLRLIPDKNDPRHQKAEVRLKLVELETESQGGR